MKAFYIIDNILIKIYDQGDDWQVICIGDGNKKIKERWFSIWKDDKQSSFLNAIKSTCEQEFKHTFNESNICYC